MALRYLRLSVDTNGLREMLSVLSDVSNRIPEFGGGLLGLLNSSEELFFIDDEVRTAPGTGDLVVGFKPSDSLLNMVAAFRATNADLLIFKHDKPPADYSAQ